MGLDCSVIWDGYLFHNLLNNLFVYNTLYSQTNKPSNLLKNVHILDPEHQLIENINKSITLSDFAQYRPRYNTLENSEKTLSGGLL